MAKFTFNGMGEISADFETLAHLSDEEKLSIIRPAANLLLERQRDKLVTLFRQLTGSLAKSLSIEERVDDDGVSAYISPKGKHPGSSTGKRRGKRRSNGKYSGTNSEVAYVLEHGSPRIAATHWMENTNEEASDDVIAAQQAAWDGLLIKKGF